MTGDIDQFALRYRGEVERFCRGQLRDREAAADAAQETWLRACQSIARGAGPREMPRAWLLTIARRACADAGRARMRATARTTDAGLDVLAAPRTSDPLTRVLASEALHELRTDLDALTGEERRALSPARSCPGGGEGRRRAASRARRRLRVRERGRSLPCDQARARVARAGAGGLAVAAHLESCPSCARAWRRAAASRLV